MKGGMQSRNFLCRTMCSTQDGGASSTISLIKSLCQTHCILQKESHLANSILRVIGDGPFNDSSSWGLESLKAKKKYYKALAKRLKSDLA